MADNQPVEVKNEEPIPVNIKGSDDSGHQTQAKIVAAKAVVDAKALTTEDQRRISGIWERTQQVIALSVVEISLIVILILVFRQDENTPTALAILFGLANLVIGFYFGRTNHQKVGGDPSAAESLVGR